MTLHEKWLLSRVYFYVANDSAQVRNENVCLIYENCELMSYLLVFTWVVTQRLLLRCALSQIDFMSVLFLQSHLEWIEIP
jgi:hypothetical protein